MAAALGEGAFEMCGAETDGAISWVCPGAYLRDVALPAMQRGAERADRPTPPLVAHVPICVHDDPEEAREAIATQFRGFARAPFYRNMFNNAGFPEVSEGVWSPGLWTPSLCQEPRSRWRKDCGDCWNWARQRSWPLQWLQDPTGRVPWTAPWRSWPKFPSQFEDRLRQEEHPWELQPDRHGERLNMDEAVRRALELYRTIDITTTGRKTGQLRRTEIWFHNIEGRLYITGTPGNRDWYANLIANPWFTFHLKHSAQADLNARATPIRDREQRQDIIRQILQKISWNHDLGAWVDGSPLVEVELLPE